MQKKAIKKVFACLCAIVLMISMIGTAFAAEINDEAAKDVMSIERATENIQRSIAVECTENTDTIIEDCTTNVGDTIPFNMNARENWRITDDIFVGTDSLTESDTEDWYLVQFTTNRAAGLRIVSNNTNLIVKLYKVAGQEATPTNFLSNASDNAPRFAGNISAGSYILRVYAEDPSTAPGDYILLWNCSNPGGASAIIEYNDVLTKITLGYSFSTGKEIYSNGVDLLADMEWEEHYTFNTSTGHSGRDQSISDIHPERVNKGTYTSSQHTAKNALFIAAGEDSLWLYVRTQYSNVNGSVVHDMDYFDISGRKTPRRFDDTDVSNGPHYVVYDMDTNEVIDFISPYNYLWQTGATKASITFTSTNII